MKRTILAFLTLLGATSAAWPQAAVVQYGSFTPGHVPVYGTSPDGQPNLIDPGSAVTANVTLSGCSLITATQVGVIANTPIIEYAAGSFQFSGSCSNQFTMSFAGLSAGHGWSCHMTNMTSLAGILQSSYTVGTAVFANPSATNNQQVHFECIGF